MNISPKYSLGITTYTFFYNFPFQFLQKLEANVGWISQTWSSSWAKQHRASQQQFIFIRVKHCDKMINIKQFINEQENGEKVSKTQDSIFTFHCQHRTWEHLEYTDLQICELSIITHTILHDPFNTNFFIHEWWMSYRKGWIQIQWENRG